MDLEGIIKNKQFGSYQKELEELYDFYQSAGNCVQSGYLGYNVSDIKRDEMGKMEYFTEYFADPVSTLSTVSVLPNSILVQQIQKSNGRDYYQLFSWDKSGERYSYVGFDNEETLKKCCEGIKRYVSDPLGTHIADVMRKLEIADHHIIDIKLNQTSPNFVQKVVPEKSEDSPMLSISL